MVSSETLAPQVTGNTARPQPSLAGRPGGIYLELGNGRGGLMARMRGPTHKRVLACHSAHMQAANPPICFQDGVAAASR